MFSPMALSHWAKIQCEQVKLQKEEKSCGFWHSSHELWNLAHSLVISRKTIISACHESHVTIWSKNMTKNCCCSPFSHLIIGQNLFLSSYYNIVRVQQLDRYPNLSWTQMSKRQDQVSILKCFDFISQLNWNRFLIQFHTVTCHSCLT